MVSSVSRQGRQLQRYTKSGGRLVVGYVGLVLLLRNRTEECIPYKFRPGGEGHDKSMEVLVISSPKGNGLLFPKFQFTIVSISYTDAIDQVTVAEAREGCQHPWMKEALERLVKRLSSSCRRRSSSTTTTIAAS
ncbi:hypothetical protein GW17_00042851 [Ensete ventricosum]|nr:hypothetical protein GW17_00042851 [Ensete ventricosum]